MSLAPNAFSTAVKGGNCSSLPNSGIKERRETTKNNETVIVSLNSSTDALTVFIGSNESLDTAFNITTITTSVTLERVWQFLIQSKADDIENALPG